MNRISQYIFIVILLILAYSVNQTLVAQVKGENTHTISHSQNPAHGTYGQIPFQHNPRSTTITESATQNIVTGNSVSCNAGGLHTDNSYYRSFVLEDFGISTDFYISDVSIGVEQAIGAGGTQPITVNLYTTSQPFPGGWPGSLTLLGTTDIQVPDQSLTIFDIPFTPAVMVPAGSELVVEIFTPDGQTTGNSFFIGSNPDGETAPSYLMAVDCGVATPMTCASIGFPTMMIVMNVTGDFTIVGPGPATDPIPANNAEDVDIDADLSWTNPGAATSVEVFFGTEVGNLTSIYSGAPISTIDPGTMGYLEDYYWKINETDGTGTTFGSTWHFTTMQNPNLQVLFFDDFENGTGLWTITNDGGTCVWEIFFPPYPNTYTLPCGTGCNGVFSADVDECGSGTTLLSSAMITDAIDATAVTDLGLEFDNDFNAIGASDEGYVEVSTDNGATWNTVWSSIGVDILNTHEVVDLGAYEGTIFKLRFRSVQPGWDWWWTIDNVSIVGGIIPVEFTAFTANASNGNVVLNWSTATETNNRGFEVQKNSGSGFNTIGFVQGNGTSTQVHNYSFIDKAVTEGSYSYRLRQVDFDGASEFSNIVEVQVVSPKIYALAQNYPNPFNPTTQINFSLAVDSKVSLKIFNILGQEVTTLFAGDMTAGSHFVTFNASNLTSGVYIYKLEANGVNGSNFSSVKKMVLTK